MTTERSQNMTRNKSIVPCWTMHTGRMSCHYQEGC